MHLIAYHSDLDGCCSAACLLERFRMDNEQEPWLLIPRTYSPTDEPIQAEKGDKVYFLDYTPKKDEFNKVRDVVGQENITWIDHHKTNIDRIDLPDDVPGLRSDTFPSASKLCYEYFLKEDRLVHPECIDLVDKWDTWSHNDDMRIIAFVWGASVWHIDENPTVREWSILLGPKVQADEKIKQITNSGCAAYQYEQNKMEQRLGRFGYDVMVPVTGSEPLKGKALNCGLVNSMAFNSVEGDYDVWVAYYFDGRHYTVSMYKASKDLDIHLGSVCSALGGGGHAGAAGFVTECLPEWLTR